MKPKPDRYDKAVAYLTRHPEEIFECWSTATPKHIGSMFTPANKAAFEQAKCLFRKAARNPRDPDCDLGCLTQVNCGDCEAQTPALTRAIRADKKIPAEPDDDGTTPVEFITVESLPIFAKWQRRLDKELGRRTY